MVNRILPWLPPDGEDESALQAEARALRERVVRLEQEIVDLRAAVERYEAHLHARVAPLQEELAELDAQIAEARLASDPTNPTLQAVARLARSHADQAREATTAARAADQVLPPADAELRAEYRQAAREMHPDHAPTEAEVQIRNDWMTRLNARYARRDLEGVRALLASWRAGGAPPPAMSRAERLAWLRGTLARLRESERRLRAQGEEIRGSDLHRLMSESASPDDPRSPVAAVVADLRRRIGHARALLDLLRPRPS